MITCSRLLLSELNISAGPPAPKPCFHKTSNLNLAFFFQIGFTLHTFLTPSSPYIIGSEEERHFFSPQTLPQLQAESNNLIDYTPTVDSVDGFPQQIDGGMKAILWHRGVN